MQPYKIDGPLEINQEHLLFWPDNPRLKISDFKEVKMPVKQLVEQRNQKKVFNLLAKHEHDVKKLAKSMVSNGFMRDKAPVVMKLNNSNKYLVLEGNRRLAAIRTVLGGNVKILKERRKTLETIPCWLFVHTSKTIPVRAAISRLVAAHHIQGQKPHTAIQKAHMLYDAYEGFLLESHPTMRNFFKDQNVINETAQFFDYGENEFEAELSVVRLYKQLRESGYELDHKIRERLTWVYGNQRHFKRYFGYDVDSFQLDSSKGVERYYDIFVRPGCAVHNPTLFKKLRNIFREGDENDVEVLRKQPKDLERIEKEVLSKKQDLRFISELRTIHKKLSALKIREYNGTESENSLIADICKLANGKLKSIIDVDDENLGSPNHIIPLQPTSNNKKRLPTTIDQALEMNIEQVLFLIQAALKNRPNNSCVEIQLPKFMLNECVIRTSGSPREKFNHLVDKSVDSLVNSGYLERYKAKNQRIRLP